MGAWRIWGRVGETVTRRGGVGLKVRGTLLGVLACLAALLALGCSGASEASSQEETQVSTQSGTTQEKAEASADQPNMIFVLTDDLDYASTQKMPGINSLLVEEGTSFEEAFVSHPVCCPSRATILTGLYDHNHEVLSNNPPSGGFEKFLFEGHEEDSIAVSLQDDGYQTAFFGKYLNAYYGDYVPPGWDEWYAVSGNFLSNDLNENGAIIRYDPDRYHLDDVLSEKASDYVERTAGADPPFFVSDRPFFMWIGTKAPHQPANPAPRHEDAYPDLQLPRGPSLDEADVSDKPGWVADNPPLSADQKRYMEELNRKRLQSMLAVDDMIGDLVGSLRRSNELNDTYIFFTSDNGFHLGQHRLGSGKWTAYEEDIRVPLVVRGPGVPEGETLSHLVLNNDLAPTFADLAGAETPSFVDGRSLAPLLDGEPTPPEDWRQAFVVEAIAERGSSRPPFIDESRVAPLLTGDPLPKDWRRTSTATAELSEGWGRPWLKALRTKNYLYVDYKSGEHELYDLKKDPHQLHNIYSSASPELRARLEAQLDALRQCEAERCRAAEGGGT